MADLKTFSKQFRQQVLSNTLSTPPDIVLGISDIISSSAYQSYIQSKGYDTSVSSRVNTNPGDVDTDGDGQRTLNLSRNLITPNDITNGITWLTESHKQMASWLGGLGQPTILQTLSVVNPGDVDTKGDSQRGINLGQNKHINTKNDVSDGGTATVPSSIDSVQFRNLRADIGKPTHIGVIPVPNPDDLDVDGIIDPNSGTRIDKRLTDAVRFNRYVPTEGFNIFDNTVLEIKNALDKSNNFWTEEKLIGYYPQQYQPSDFIGGVRTNLDDGFTFDLNAINLQQNIITDGIGSLIGGGTKVIPHESLLMNIAALELEFNFNTRIQDAIIRDTVMRTSLDEALTNPAAALNILKDPKNSLFEKSYQISIPTNPVSKAVDLVNNLTGYNSVYYHSGLLDFFESPYYGTFLPTCFPSVKPEEQELGMGARLMKDITGQSIRKKDRDAWILNRTGAGHKSQLFQSLTFNKYQPDYVPDYETGIAQGLFDAIDNLKSVTGFFGFTEGKRPAGQYYIGKHDFNDAVDILQEEEFFQSKTNEALTKEWEINYNKTEENPFDYYGEGLVKIGDYGVVSSEFMWAHETTMDGSQFDEFNKDSGFLTQVSWNNRTTFRECSLLDITQKLRDRDTITTRAIDQVTREFTDEYGTRISRGSAVKNIDYKIDETGRRIYPTDEVINRDGELCRVWTKDRKYGDITTTLRYSELIRKERNSVLDRYGNLNIFPSELNVNTGYGNPGLKTSDGRPLTTEYFGERRARKYMLSLENLAWKGSDEERSLPPCEKGPNGGRVMWFPPYELTATDNTSADWSSTVFLGRPEPIYTYNSAERIGTLGFKIIVDHPSILNLLVSKELGGLEEKQVDSILDAFWAGCIKYDVFELARMWGVFSIDEVEYFKSVIDSIRRDEENIDVLNQIDKATVSTTPKIKPVIGGIPEGDESTNDDNFENESNLGASFLFFENDIPNTDNLDEIDKYQTYFSGYLSNMEKADGITKGKIFYTDATNTTTETFSENYKSGFGTTLIRDDIGETPSGNEIPFGGTEKGVYTKLAYDNFKENWDTYNKNTKGFNIKLNLKSYASPKASSSYNETLAKKRFIAVVKNIVDITTDASSDVNGKKRGGNLDYSDIFNSDYTEAIFYKPSNVNKINDKVTLINSEYQEVKSPLQDGGPTTNKHSVIDGVLTYDMDYELPDGSGNCTIVIVDVDDPTITNPICDESVDKVYAWYVSQYPNATITITDKLTADCIAIAPISGLYKGNPYEAAMVGSTVSPLASYSRRTQITAETPIPNPEIVPDEIEEEIKNIKVESVRPVIEDSTTKVKFGQVTKRDIAQRILNKLVTECDYFDYLDAEYPGTFSTMKEKLKYFSPAFHSMTPEGLNARLTFLQQCLRPGKTIKTSNGNTCDANNTVFGKPPVCVLRLGDFYHSKIIINDVNISYEPGLALDLNPEGIGVQPMLATVNLAFKFIGGQGIRGPVEQLQNALSFNYYANTDIYDDRTFANNDEYERSLLNTEVSFFDQNEHDLQQIIGSVKNIKDSDNPSDKPEGTIGLPVVGGNQYDNIETPTAFSGDSTYIAGELTLYNGIIYTATGDIFGEVPGISSLWELNTDYDITRGKDDNSIGTYQPFMIPKKGLYPYHVEYGNYYVEHVKLDYYTLFERLYDNLNYLYESNLLKYNKLSDSFGDTGLYNNPFVNAAILMKNVNKFGNGPLKLYGGTGNNILNSLSSLPHDYTKDGTSITEFVIDSDTTITEVGFGDNDRLGDDGEVTNSNELNGGNYYKFGLDKNPITNDIPQLMLLHLYPQGGNYKLPSVGTYSGGLTSNAEVKYPNDNFTPRAFRNLDIPKPELFNSRGGIEKLEVLDLYKTRVLDLIESDNLSALRRIMVNSNTDLTYTFNDKRLSGIFSDIKLKLRQGLKTNATNNFNTYTGLFTEFLSNVTSDDIEISVNTDTAYTDAIKTMDELSVILNGFDVDNNDGKMFYYEVVPNAVTGNTKTHRITDDGVYHGDWDDHMGYNPLMEMIGPGGIEFHIGETTDYRITLPNDVERTYKFKHIDYTYNQHNTTKTIFGSGASQSLTSENMAVVYQLAPISGQTLTVTDYLDNKLSGVTTTEYAIDYYLTQIGLYDDYIVDTIGKTRYVGLPYIDEDSDYQIKYEVNTGNNDLTGVVVDRVLDNQNFTGYDDINYTGTDILTIDGEGKEYYSIMGTLTKTVIDGGYAYKYEVSNEITHPEQTYTDQTAINTTFERMGHEIINLATRYNSVRKLDVSDVMADINSIYDYNELEYSGSVSGVATYVASLNSTHIVETLNILGVRSYSSYPVLNMGMNETHQQKMAELSQVLYFDAYFDDTTFLNLPEVTPFTNIMSKTGIEYNQYNLEQETNAIIDGINPLEEARIIKESVKRELPNIKMKNVRNFEEILFANLIYNYADLIIDELIITTKEKKFKEFKRTMKNNGVALNERRRKQFEEQQLATVAYLETVKANVIKIQKLLTDVYGVVDADYREVTTINQTVFHQVKPTIITKDADEYAYQLKMRKVFDTSQVNKAIYGQYLKTRDY